MKTLVLLLLMVLPLPVEAQSLTVARVDPPNWWTGMTWQSVQLMLYGEDFTGLSARLENPPPGLRIAGVRTVQNPRYAFLTLEIGEGAPAGTYGVALEAGGRTARFDFPILPRPPREGRHQGFGPSDTVYLITPDRFANGDPANDHVEGAGLYPDTDRSDPGRRHGGDLRGLIDRLDYLADLGVTALWLNPVLENRGRVSYHGYAATDLYRIDPRFGSNEDYRELVEAAHRRGLKVIFDHINNHIGVQHPWAQDPPTPTWFNGTAGDPPPSHDKLAITDPYADAATVQRLQGFWFTPGMPDLNQRDPLLAHYRIQNTLWWIEYAGIDGIREDTYPYVDLPYLARWAKAILTEYPGLNIVGEIWEDQPAHLAQFQYESRMPRAFETNLPAVMDFPLSEAFRAYLRGDGTLNDVYKVLSQDFVYTDPDNLLTLFDNHDMTRGIYEAGGDGARVKQVLAMLLTMRGIPQLLYGTEINMVGGASHVELRADMPGGWPGDTRDAFTAQGRTDAENDIFDFTRHLLHLRRRIPALTCGTTLHWAPQFLRRPPWRNDVYSYLRQHDDEAVLVVVNGDGAPVTEDLYRILPHVPSGALATDLLTGERVDLASGTLSVAAHGVRLIHLH